MFRVLRTVCVLGCGSAAKPQASNEPAVELKIAAASDLQFALEEVALAFHESQSDIKLTVTTGSSGKLFAQLSQDAPFNVFLSADIQYPRS